MPTATTQAGTTVQWQDYNASLDRINRNNVGDLVITWRFNMANFGLSPEVLSLTSPLSTPPPPLLPTLEQGLAD